ncbi:hypothetical protein TorRG33x02_248820 [Trema orientale]|uniref:Uncharacterized protein n=1 Tax=Trema orientale TaxID=63057 RepID=A0A2P5DJZ9_TREOI|nr:hypothetical protein TorRG33x02_248820 [Trema orientale]
MKRLRTDRWLLETRSRGNHQNKRRHLFGFMREAKASHPIRYPKAHVSSN